MDAHRSSIAAQEPDKACQGHARSLSLETGIEWNYRTVSSAEGNAVAEVAQAFESLFAHPTTKELTGPFATGLV